MLSLVFLKHECDEWHWSLDTSGRFTFTAKSLMADLVNGNGEERRLLFEVVWKFPFPVKTKIFLWELAQELIWVIGFRDDCLIFLFHPTGVSCVNQLLNLLFICLLVVPLLKVFGICYGLLLVYFWC